jgi:hypothetical protein
VKYTLIYRIDCPLQLPDGKPLEIERFTFLPGREGGEIAKRIKIEVEAQTKEEAKREAQKLLSPFLIKLTILHEVGYKLLSIYSIQEGQMTTKTLDISARLSLAVDGALVKDSFERKIQGKRLRIRPLSHYYAGINTTDSFSRFRHFYLVLEFYLKDTKKITLWIQTKRPDIEKKKDQYGHTITIISWIRHKLSHAKKDGRGLTPLLISNPKHVELVEKHIPIVQELAREIIREKEKI